MRKIVCLLMIVLLVLMMFTITGCGAQSNIKSSEEASEAVSDLGEDISGVGSALDDIDQGLSED